MDRHPYTDMIEAAIPFGRENAISRKELSAMFRMSDRKMRSAIEDARLDGLIIINAQDGQGYFQSADTAEMLRQYNQDTARALSIFRRRKPLREKLIAAGIDVRHYGGQAMLQYCRYCCNAFDYNGEGEDFICEANAPCGNNGAGAFYPASKAKRPNKCPHFEFCEYDIFRAAADGGFVSYRPRAATGKAQAAPETATIDQQSLF